MEDCSLTDFEIPSDLNDYVQIGSLIEFKEDGCFCIYRSFDDRSQEVKTPAKTPDERKAVAEYIADTFNLMIATPFPGSSCKNIRFIKTNI